MHPLLRPRSDTQIIDHSMKPAGLATPQLLSSATLIVGPAPRPVAPREGAYKRRHPDLGPGQCALGQAT